MKKRTVLYISGTRADYGLVKANLLCIKNDPGLELEIAVTGMHLMAQFGKTINEIKKDGFKIHPIEATYAKDSKASMATFAGKFMELLVGKIEKIKPDVILVLGDRAEMLVAAVVGAYASIPVAHIHGGDISSTVDDIARHAITKLSHIHFPATKKSAERIVKMGEEKWRVYVVGTPGLDDMLSSRVISPKQIAKTYALDLSKPMLLVTHHPVTMSVNQAVNQMQQTMQAVFDLGFEAIVVYPNADAGGRAMIKVIEKYRKYPFIKIFKNIPRADYIGLLNVASLMIGNSSSGIIEAPSFGLPVVNIGTRQAGRERAKNIIDVDYKKEDIKKAIKKALFDKKFKQQVRYSKNPYIGTQMAGLKIAKVLGGITIDEKLLQKKLSDR